MKYKTAVFILLALTLALHTLLHSLPSPSPPLLHLLLTHKLLLLLSLLYCTSLSLASYLLTRPRPVLLLDYSCYRPGLDRRCTLEICEYFGLRSRRFSDTSADFMRAIYSKSGLGDETYGPPFVFQSDYDSKFSNAVLEAEESLFGATESLMNKTGIEKEKLTHLIVVCSMFSPAPSLASLVVNHLGLGENVKTYNLSGMGCSAGTVAFDLAAQILKGREIGYVLILVTESFSLNW